jgi:hypothetical protein
MTSAFLATKFSPLKQALFCLVFGLIAMLLFHFFLAGTAHEFSAALTAIILFTIMNSFISIFNPTFLKYTWPSYGLFTLLLIVLLLSARVLSGISIWKLVEYRMMVTSIIIFYLVASVLVRIIRMMWEFAEEDIN